MVKNVEDKLTLRVKPSYATQVNKPLVIILVGLLVVLIGFAVVAALNATPKQAGQSSSALMINDVKPAVLSSIQSLPENYQDSQGIKKYLSSNQAVSGEIPASVQQELSSLKAQQLLLEQKLAIFSQQKQIDSQQNSEEIKQAETSGLFFPGVAPPRLPTAEEVAQQLAQAKSEAASQGTGTSAEVSGYVGQNMQLQKMDFLKPSKEDEDIYNPHSLMTPLSPYEVQAGTVVSADLITAIDTSLPGEVVAQVQDDLYDSTTGRYLLIPKGSKLLGKYDSQISYGQTRVLIVFYRIIRPNGSSILLSKSTGADLLGQSGMAGEVENHWGRVLGAATLSTLLSIGAGVASDGVANDGSTLVRTAGQNAMLGAAGSVSQTGQNLTERAMNIQPTLKIPAGYQFNVIVNKDMILKPFIGTSS